MNKRRTAVLAAATLVLAVLAGSAAQAAQETVAGSKPQEAKIQSQKANDPQKPDSEKEKKPPVIHEEITVTATRIETKVFNTPSPVSIVNARKIEIAAPDNVSDLLPEMPGTDIVGVGANQGRPVIRGLRGQRILLLTDGIRMSNSRRSQDFGEIPALVDVSSTERIEVVRGPSSVLYGSDAIGGVINIISRVPDYSGRGSRISGQAGYRFGSADDQHKGFADVSGKAGPIVFALSGFYRDSREYQAPAGRFGNIVLNEATTVRDSGVRDYGFDILLGTRLGDNELTLKYDRYNAHDAGFGFVEPALYSPSDPTIQLLYPKQNLNRLTLRYENRALGFFLADGISWTGYWVGNDRDFSTNISISFFPGAGLNIRSRNFTGITTLGARLELTKVLFRSHVLTYGVDLYRDSSENTDSSTQTMFGLGPPRTTTSTVPNIPNATFRSLGFFVQDQWSFFKRASLVLGMRYQDNSARTSPTPGLTDPVIESRDKTLVGALNLIYGLAENLNVFFSAGRGFRSPNLTERFFEGVTPDGSGYEIRTPGLNAETSLNVEAGLRYRLGGFYLDTSYFRNTLYDGITIVATGETYAGLPMYKNVNIDRLRFQGVEVGGQFDFGIGLVASANYTYILSKNLTNAELPYTDTYGSRLNLNVHYDFPRDLFWVEYAVRHTGEKKDVDLGINPIGTIIPGYVVHTVRAGTTLFKKSRFPQQVGLIVGNLTNVLYSEVANASFFRPAPKRSFVLTWSTRF